MASEPSRVIGSPVEMTDRRLRRVLDEMARYGCHRAIVAVRGRRPGGDERVVFGFARRSEAQWPLVDAYPLGLISATGIDVENYDVQCLLEPYMERVREPIESADVIVEYYVVTPAGVRAHPESGGWEMADVTVPFPDGVYEKLVKLSRGPRTMRPKLFAFGSEVEPMLDRFDDILFSGNDMGPVYMNARDYAVIRKFHGGGGTERLDPTTLAVELKRGLQGHIRGSTSASDPRRRTIYLARQIPVGYVYLAGKELSVSDLPPMKELDPTRLVPLITPDGVLKPG